MKIEFEKLLVVTKVGCINAPFKFEQPESSSRFRKYDSVLKFEVGNAWGEKENALKTLELSWVIEKDHEFLKKQIRERLIRHPELDGYYGELTLKGASIDGDNIRLYWLLEEGLDKEDMHNWKRFCKGNLYLIESTEKFENKKYNYMAFFPIVDSIKW